jgi:hypothetical protein
MTAYADEVPKIFIHNIYLYAGAIVAYVPTRVKDRTIHPRRVFG